MSLLVVGSMAIDSIITPVGEAAEALGGSACYFSYAASYFGPVRLVGVVGEDFPREYLQVLVERGNIDVSGVQHAPGKTFRWKGRYSQDMNSRETLEVHLNVLGTFEPHVPQPFRDSRFVFLGNAGPDVQMRVLEQIRAPELVVADTMDLWIETQRDGLVGLLARVDGLVCNDSEALLLTQERQLVNAGRAILKMGPKFVIVKKGEHGAMLFSERGIAPLPAFPVERLTDPTGAGDSFAGGMLGYLANTPKVGVAHDHYEFKRALAYGTVTASLTVEDFSLNRLRGISRAEIESRYVLYRDMLNVG